MSFGSFLAGTLCGFALAVVGMFLSGAHTRARQHPEDRL